MNIPEPFSLALGGGAARGLAHIGVIRHFEELDISPRAISGTSMGAIIATLLALGRNSHEMEAIVQDLKWSSFIDLDMRKGLIKGKKIEKFLDILFEGKTFEDTQIPLSITSTDINTGECIIFSSGSLSHAVRASIGIPGVFCPYEYQHHQLVDGGLTANLPIESLPEGSVIAISAMRDLSREMKYERRVFSRDWQKTIFGNGYNILQKTIDIILSQNEARSVASREYVTYIRPEFDGLDYYEFYKYKEFIRSGYEAMKDELI